jgi:hypothetical protein
LHKTQKHKTPWFEPHSLTDVDFGARNLLFLLFLLFLLVLPVFSLGLGVIYLFNLYSTIPCYFGDLKKKIAAGAHGATAPRCLQQRAASCTEFQAFSFPAVRSFHPITPPPFSVTGTTKSGTEVSPVAGW